MIRKTALIAALAAIATLGVAHAAPLTGTFTMEVYNGTGVPTNATLGSLPAGIADTYFTYTGPIDFNVPAGNSNLFSTFFGSYASGISGFNSSQFSSEAAFLNATMSTSGSNQIDSFIGIVGSTPYISNITVTHDDGASLYYGFNGNVANPAFTGTGFQSGSETTAIPNTAVDVPGGTIGIAYVEANGAPSVLITDVPEPSSLAVLGTGLLGLGLLLRRRARKG